MEAVGITPHTFITYITCITCITFITCITCITYVTYIRLVLISEAGGITPLVTMLSSANSLARENAAGALMHLARDPANQIAIAKANGILPLVTILDDGTPLAHQHSAEAILRLAVKNVENQTQTAKHLVALLANENTGE